MSNYIKAIRLPGTLGMLDLAFPTKDGLHNAVNVICGLNNSGKSFLLERTRAAIEKSWDRNQDRVDQHVVVTMSNPGGDQPKCRFFGKTWRQKATAGLISISKDLKKHPRDIPDYKRIFLKMLHPQMNAHLPANKQVSTKEWLENSLMRKAVAEHFVPDKAIYKFLVSEPLVQQIEAILEGKLYFRRAIDNQFDLMLVQGDKTALQYSEWSDGQQAVLYIIALIEDEHPDIVLLDEIENHLHPAFMSKILGVLKENVPQTIVATHHPHVIFSELADKVFYIEASRPNISGLDLPRQLPYQKQAQLKAPRRTVYTLENNFDKVTASYHLFDQRDRQLLKQAGKISNDAEVLFYNSLAQIFSSEIIEPSGGLIPDRQTLQVIEEIRMLIKSDRETSSVRVLDLGSGFGRLVVELSKVSNWRLGAAIDWTCWEYKPEVREKLKLEIAQRAIRAEIPDTLSAVTDQSFDLCVIANVLHELSPNGFADLICIADQKLAGVDGRILVLELFPLLTAEKFAVPYAPSVLVEIFNEVGLIATYTSMAVHDATAYCLAAHRRVPAVPVSRNFVKETVERYWLQIEERAVSSYRVRKSIANYEGYRGTIQDLTTVASVQAWRCGIWN